MLRYLIAEYDGMQQRCMGQASAQRQEFDAYVRDTASGRSAAAEIAKAKELLDRGRDHAARVRGADGEALAQDRWDTTRAHGG